MKAMQRTGEECRGAAKSGQEMMQKDNENKTGSKGIDRQGNTVLQRSLELKWYSEKIECKAI